MIQMICGACRVENTLRRAVDGPFSLSPDAELRLVNAGVAQYITQPLTAVATPENDDNSVDNVDTYTETAAADDVMEIVDGHFTIESLMQLTRANMDELAAKLGVDISKCRNKSEIAELLAAVNVDSNETDEEAENPPDLGAAPPVI